MNRSLLILCAIALGLLNEYRPLSENAFMLITVFGAAILLEYGISRSFRGQSAKIAALELELKDCRQQIETITTALAFEDRHKPQTYQMRVEPAQTGSALSEE